MAKRKQGKRKTPAPSREQSSGPPRRRGGKGEGEKRSFDPAFLGLGALLFLPPFFFVPGLADSFRLPKTLLTETLALISIGLLALRIRGRSPAQLLDRLLRSAAFRAVMPLVLLASLGVFFTDYPEHVRQALPSLWVGAAALVAWSLGLGAAERRRLLGLLALPATALACLAILQFHGLSTPFEFDGRVTERIALTSLAGGAFDLAAYLVLPILVSLVAAYDAVSKTRQRVHSAVAIVCAYALVITSTFTAIIALAAGLAVLAWALLPRHLLHRAAAAMVVIGIVVASVGPLAPRVQKKAKAVANGDINRVLTGRLDGWRAALRMAADNPATGVGLGAYRPAFGPARYALRQEGVEFYRGQHRAYFVNAHSDPLELLGELGIPGLLALLWAAVWTIRGSRRFFAGTGDRGNAEGEDSAAERALVPAGLLALCLLALVYFPFHLALVAYPWLLFLGIPLSPVEPRSAGSEVGDAEAEAGAE